MRAAPGGESYTRVVLERLSSRMSGALCAPLSERGQGLHSRTEFCHGSSRPVVYVGRDYYRPRYLYEGVDIIGQWWRAAYHDIRSYRQKVIDYLAEHADIPVIRKIKNLEKVNETDLRELERILWFELGTKNDYLNTTDIKNLAAFVRSVVGIDQRAVNEKFGKYLNGSALTVEQQEFLKTIIDYVRENGNISKTDLLEAAPFNEYNIIEVFGESVPVVNDIVSTLENVIAAPEGFFDFAEARIAM